MASPLVGYFGWWELTIRELTEQTFRSSPSIRGLQASIPELEPTSELVSSPSSLGVLITAFAFLKARSWTVAFGLADSRRPKSRNLHP